MESLIAKQNISRRFRQAPAVKRPSPLLAFGLSGQKRAKRPLFAQRKAIKNAFSRRAFRDTQDRPSPSFKRQGGGIAAILGILSRRFAAKASERQDIAPRTFEDPREKTQGRLLFLIACMSALAAAFGMCLATIKLGDNRFPVREADFALPVPAEGLDLLTALENSAPTEGFQPDSGMIATELPISLAISYHTLQRGETIDSVAKRYGRDRDSIISMNGIVNVKRVPSGSKLKIPNMNGIIHVVAGGDSLGKIAARYKTDVTSILDANNLESYSIRKGQSLFIPGGKLDKGTLKQALGDLFSWPVRGLITSGFGYRLDPFTQVRRFHQAIDILGSMGQRINAAMEGRVVETGYNTIYGNYVILSHDGGFQTCYAHLSRVSVRNGQRVDRGTKLGEMGSTGYSTGTHLHFAIYRKGSAVNPRGFLPK